MNEDLDHFHRARSKCLDAFAAIEGEVVTLLRRTGASVNGEPMGHKVDALKKTKPGSQYSNATQAKVVQLLGELEHLLPIRADMVHGRLKLVVMDDTNTACFINARYAGSGADFARLINAKQFTSLTGKLSRLAAELTKLAQVNPASSPPPPSPGAAGGP